MTIRFGGVNLNTEEKKGSRKTKAKNSFAKIKTSLRIEKTVRKISWTANPLSNQF